MKINKQVIKPLSISLCALVCVISLCVATAFFPPKKLISSSGTLPQEQGSATSYETPTQVESSAPSTASAVSSSTPSAPKNTASATSKTTSTASKAPTASAASKPAVPPITTTPIPTVSVPSSNNGSVTPSGGLYMNVGSQYVAQVVVDSAETFDGNTTNDYSKPTNSYLPKGTVDYCSSGTVKDSSSGRTYRKLRCGKRVYQKTEKTSTFIKVYKGTLPNTNQLQIDSCQTSGKYTLVTLNTAWKAPFYFELNPVNYVNPAGRDFRFGDASYSYVDITFCYADALTYQGETDLSSLIGSYNPVFSKAKLIQNKNDYTLRLYLKTKGEFYGWSASYTTSGQLVFRFLHPPKASKTSNNEYGADLSNTTVFIDVGHGGNDPGAVENNIKEAASNLLLALKLRAELKKTGCNVVIDRTNNATMKEEDRIAKLKAASADLAISIHRDSNSSSSVHGYSTYFYYPYSRQANQLVYKYNAGLYGDSSHSGVDWHYFFLGRVSNCPVVLTENGYISNKAEAAKIKDDAFNTQCAIATTKGIVEYFLKNKQ